jgi:hypothetical protein
VEIQELWDAGLGETMKLVPPGTAGLESIYDQAVCGADDSLEAKCYASSESAAYEMSRAVARLLIGGTSLCTGWLIGCEGHVMTNQHCIPSQEDADDVDFELMAEGGSCAEDCRSTLACPGSIEASGSTLIAVDHRLDYALVLPDTTLGGDTNLSTTYGYLQLRETGPVLGERLYVPQHPAGWGKRIALESTHALDAGFVQVNSLTEPACFTSQPQEDEAGYFGDTRGGSSGSPVLAYSDHRVVALHHCQGEATCTGTGGDPNRGVPIDSVIADLGAALPACSTATCSPQPVAAAGPDRVICQGDETTIGTATLADHTYSWSPGGETTAQVTVSPAATTPYTVTATTSCGSQEDSVLVVVDDGSGGGLSEDFEGDVSGWTTTGLWHVTSDSSCATPAYSSPTTAFYYGNEPGCSYTTGDRTAGNLLSPPIFGITPSSTLTFDYRREVEEFDEAYDITEVEVLTTSGPVTVWYKDSSDPSVNVWLSSGPISLADFTGQTIQLRFRFDSVDLIGNGTIGWLIDDVVVTGDSPCSECPDHLVLSDETIGGTASYRADNLVTLGPDLVVDGDEIEVVAGQRVVIGSGVAIGGSFSAGTDPGACTP